MSSGLIYAVIVGAWAAVLIPMWLRRHDARAASRALSPSTRLLTRPRRNLDPSAVRRRSRTGHAHGRPAHRPLRRRRGSSIVARRRRLLLTLLALTGALAGLALLSTLPAWPAVLSGVLVVGYVAHLRAQARRLQALEHSREAARERLDARMRRVDTAERVVAVHRAREAERALERAPAAAQAEELAALEEAAREAAQRAEEAWDPRTAPLPTYVTAPKAPRPARSIDLSAGRVWVSPAPASPQPELEPRPEPEPVEEPAAEASEASEASAAEDVPRAVND